MKIFTEQAFKKAKHLIENKGRPIDQTFFRWYFENGSKEEVCKALATYQNQDGGFGHKIEPDFWLELSSPMATTIALRYIKDIQLPSSHPIVKDAIQYLLHTYDETTNRWVAVPPEVNEVPHAVWWHYDEQAKRTNVEKAWGNPYADITAYFHLYHELVPEKLLAKLTENCLTYLQGQDDLSMHETFCYLRLAEQLPRLERQVVYGKISTFLYQLVKLTREEWESYETQPLMIAASPTSPFYEELKSYIEENLDYIIDSQNEDGSWSPNWEWGQFSDEWIKAKELWKGHLTVEKLILLHRFNRIASPMKR